MFADFCTDRHTGGSSNKGSQREDLATQQGLCWHGSNAPDMWAWHSAETLVLGWSWLSVFLTPHCSAASSSLGEPYWECCLLNITRSWISVGPQQVDLLRLVLFRLYSFYIKESWAALFLSNEPGAPTWKGFCLAVIRGFCCYHLKKKMWQKVKKNKNY